ncbi:filamentous hemagglutinin N-terminal domain-containing protein, partial [Sandaracinobacter sp. RS1-74]|uniref:two-partner secretion domain-containing protein n=1 Tax=Sandaracinobacteroides sayramensis TaxID=2913411 RepID=UPI001EDBA596
MTAKTQSARCRLLVGASLATLMLANSAAQAAHPGTSQTVISPAARAAQAAQSAATQNSQAIAAAQRSRAALQQASRIRTQMDAAQIAAREAAKAAESAIKNGLGEGGLKVAEGVATDPSLWVGARGPTQAQGADGRTKVEVTQTEQKAILNWDSFNVGKETDLNFNQQGNSHWIALNRVTDASADPSKILGSIKADGSVYLINRNGIIFGGSSTVNTRNLIAATANITNEQF